MYSSWPHFTGMFVSMWIQCFSRRKTRDLPNNWQLTMCLNSEIHLALDVSHTMQFMIVTSHSLSRAEARFICRRCNWPSETRPACNRPLQSAKGASNSPPWSSGDCALFSSLFDPQTAVWVSIFYTILFIEVTISLHVVTECTWIMFGMYNCTYYTPPYGIRSCHYPCLKCASTYFLPTVPLLCFSAAQLPNWILLTFSNFHLSYIFWLIQICPRWNFGAFDVECSVLCNITW